MVQIMAGQVNVLDPTGEVYRASRSLAHREGSIRGKVVALLDNHRPEAKVFLDALGDVLLRDHQVGRVLRRSKPNQSLPCPEDTFQELLRDADYLVAGVGA